MKIFGLAPNGDLDSADIPKSFEVIWKNEEIGIRSKLVFSESSVAIVPAFHVGFNVAKLSLLNLVFALALASSDLSYGILWAILSLPFTIAYYRSLQKHIEGLPINIAESRSNESSEFVSINSIRGLLVRENSERTDDPRVVQLFVLLKDKSFLLIHQRLWFRRKKLIDEAVRFRDWLNRFR